MKIKNIYRFIIYAIIVLSFFSYGQHIYHDYYVVFQFLVTAMTLLLFFIFTKFDTNGLKTFRKILTRKYYLLFMFGLMIFNTIIGHLSFKYNQSFSFINVILFTFCALTHYFIIPIICHNYPKIKKGLIELCIKLILALAIFAILLQANHGNLFGFRFIYGRNASFYYDMNFAAMILGFGLTLNLFMKKNKILILLEEIILGSSIYLTGSRGTVLSLIFVLVFYIIFLSKIKFYKKTLYAFILFVLIQYILSFLYSVDFFRIYQGTNNRTDMVQIAFEETIKSPIFGYGYQSISGFLDTKGFINASTHNSYIDFLFAYGYPALLLYLYFIYSIFKRHALEKKQKNAFLAPTIFLILNASSILFSFGGAGIGSILFTLSLGFLSYEEQTDNNLFVVGAKQYLC